MISTPSLKQQSSTSANTCSGKSSWEEHHEPFTPTDPNISSILRDAQSSTNDDEQSPKWPKYIQLTPDQFNHLLDMCPKQQNLIDPLSTPSSLTPSQLYHINSTPTLAYCANAKYEEILCKPIKPPYVGSVNSLTILLFPSWLVLTYILKMKVGLQLLTSNLMANHITWLVTLPK